MCEQEDKVLNKDDNRKEQEINNPPEIKSIVKSPNYKRQIQGACLILFGILLITLLNTWEWMESIYFFEFTPWISLLCGVLGVIVAFSDSIKDFLNLLNE